MYIYIMIATAYLYTRIVGGHIPGYRAGAAWKRYYRGAYAGPRAACSGLAAGAHVGRLARNMHAIPPVAAGSAPAITISHDAELLLESEEQRPVLLPEVVLEKLADRVDTPPRDPGVELVRVVELAAVDD